MRITFLLAFIVISLAIFGGIIVLQVFLSKKESKWPGLILPGICLLISLTVVMSILLFMVVSPITTTTFEYLDTIPAGSPVGERIYTTDVYVLTVEQIVMTTPTPAIPVIINAVNIFLLFNIPTLLLLCIYAACRSSRKRQRDLGKMSIQDLE